MNQQRERGKGEGEGEFTQLMKPWGERTSNSELGAKGKFRVIEWGGGGER